VAKKVELVLIDPQNDFCDPVRGTLYVKGADEDCLRLAAFVRKVGRSLNDISVTRDSHHDIDIAHPYFWRNSEGKNPTPFTIISADDVNKGVWLPAVPSKNLRDRAIHYVQQLATGGRYPLCIWPPHCIIGSWGNNIKPELLEALREWEIREFATVNAVIKGSNPYTEHYSAIKADVADPTDPFTQINTAFIQKLLDCDEILIAGEALSHCVANTFRDVATEFGNDEYIKKMVLLKDASSNVPGFESYGDAFVKDMTARGMRVTTTKDYVA
jgi:nicotinamidase/pyrazinamidase